MAVQNINTYTGNAGLGQGTAGGTVGPIGANEMKNINEAMDKLVQYDVLYRRDKWARNNLLVDQDAQKAASMMTFTIGNWRPDDRDAIMKEINAMHQMYNVDPKRVRLKSDGSNAPQVSEFQGKAYRIEAMIARANARKVQDNALNKQIEGATDDEERAGYVQWKAQEDKKTIDDDILLAPSMKPFIPLDTPDGAPIDVGPTYDAKGNIESITTKTLPDLGAGMANYEFLLNSAKGKKAREFIAKGLDDFNKLIERVKEEEVQKMANKGAPPSEQDIYNALKATEEGRNKLNLLERFNRLAKINNENAAQTGMAEQDEIKWMDGIDQNDYIKMLVAGGAKSAGDKLRTTKVGIGQEEDELAQRALEAKNQSSQFWASLRQRAQEHKDNLAAGKNPEIDPSIKNSVITSLVEYPFQPGVILDTDNAIELPKTTELKNMFRVTIPETEEKIKGGTVETTTKHTELEITSIRAQKVGQDANNTRIIVKYKNPITGDETTNTFDRAGLSLPANNIFGEGSAASIARADAKFKTGIKENNPTIEQMKLGKSTGVTQDWALPANRTKVLGFVPSGEIGSSTNPLPVPTKDGIHPVMSEVAEGKSYYDKNGRVLIIKPKK